MKTLPLLLCLLVTILSFAQDNFTYNNQTIALKTEVEGDYDLLWNTFDGQFRYFIKDKSEQLIELTNTKQINNNYDFEYKNTLKSVTNLDASKTKFTLYSLKKYFNQANAASNPNYTFKDNSLKLKTRLGLFGGLTNHPFVYNPDNNKATYFGAELEFFESKAMPVHSGFLNFRTSLKTSDFEYNLNQIALGYRFRFINKTTFNIYAQTKIATYTTSSIKSTYEDPESPENVITIENKSNGFDVPLIFGLGANFKIGAGFVTIVYDSLFAVLQENEDQFPVDFAIGYKFNL